MISKCYLLFSACILSRLYGKVSQRLHDMILQENECTSPNENTALFSQTVNQSPLVLCDFPGPSYPQRTLADHCFGARGPPPASTLILTQGIALRGAHSSCCLSTRTASCSANTPQFHTPQPLKPVHFHYSYPPSNH